MGKMTKLIMFVLLMVCAFLGGVFGGEVKEIIAAKDGVAEVIKARKIVIVNEQGKEMGIIQVEKNDYPSIRLKYSDGKPLFAVGSDRLYGAVLNLFGASGHNIFAVQADLRRDSRIVLTGDNTFISMGTKEKENLIKLHTFDKGLASVLAMRGNKGGYPLYLSASNKQEAALTMFGGDGRNLFDLRSTPDGLRIDMKENNLNTLKMTGDELIDKLEKIK